MFRKFALSALIFLFVASCTKSQDRVVTLQKETTLSIIKPDAVGNNYIGRIIAKLESQGLRVAAIKMKHLTEAQAKDFYKIHQSKPFYNDLASFISSGPIVALVLEGDNAISKNRAIMGATDPQKALTGTIRREFAESMSKK